MRRREGIVDVVVDEGRQAANQIGLEHLLGFELHGVLECRDLFAEVSQIAQQDGLAGPQRADPVLCGWARHVVDVRDRRLEIA